MTVSKKQRQLVHDKSGGVCWYCGDDLPKRWHVDHVEPVMRTYNSPHADTGTHMSRPDLHTLDNMVPSCPQCNLWKSSSSIEQFRKRISAVTEVVRHYSVKFRNAERFGMVMEIKKPVTFWFERDKGEDG